MFPSNAVFWRNESGSVSIDWIVLTAGVLVFALGLASVVFDTPGRSERPVAVTMADQPLGN